MTVVYPVVFTPLEEGGYLAYVPDLKINTHGEDLAQAILMARDAIGVIGLDIEDDGDPLPVPSKSVPHQDNEIVSLVDVDLAAYRRAHDMRTVRRNVTLPSYLNELGEKAGLNFSQVLQDGLRQRLGVQLFSPLSGRSFYVPQNKNCLPAPRFPPAGFLCGGPLQDL